ncbi:MAG: acyl-CoA dehydrogenase family protein [bacterium]|nr:acyl-CoA dehydrogenase family protein [bacterium]
MLEKMGKGVEIAEEHREKRRHDGFIADLFRGKAGFNYIFPWRGRTDADWAKEKQVIGDLMSLLLKKVDPELVDQTHDLPPEIFSDLAQQGFFALKVPEEQGGRGLSQTAYGHVIELANSYSTAVGILLSADNTIGAKFPVMHYGTPEQKAKYLPELSKTPSAFCFTEKDVGSDPAQMGTYALRIKTRHGQIKGYILTGEKWYITNSVLEDGKPLAKYLAVVTKIVDNQEDVAESKYFGMFIIPSDAVGIEIGPRNKFCGIHGIYNATIKLRYVLVDPDQLIGQEGQGFKIALEALNTGRISISAGCLGLAKKAFSASQWWAKTRSQWGKLIGQHEAIGAGFLTPAASNILAMEAMVNHASSLVDRERDVRLTAAVCKVFCSEHMWTIVDNTMQIFGGRGYETYASLSSREKTAAVERIWRDARPNRIFEGSTQILSQWVLREGLDEFIKQATTLLDGKEDQASRKKRFKIVWRLSCEYLRLFWPNEIQYVELPYPYLKKHLKFVEKRARKLKRALMILGAKFRNDLAHRQLIMEGCFWIATDLFAISVILSYAQNISARFGLEVFDLADIFCRQARLRIDEQFRKIWKNEDHQAGLVASKIMEGHYKFLHEGIM